VVALQGARLVVDVRGVGVEGTVVVTVEVAAVVNGEGVMRAAVAEVGPQSCSISLWLTTYSLTFSRRSPPLHRRKKNVVHPCWIQRGQSPVHW
jgi:hypothetical protein